MPRSEDPVLDLPMITVITIYPGASPKDIESQVVDQMEEAINELDDIVDVNTSIRDGLAVIRIEFLFGVDLAEKEDEVQSQVNSIKGALPSGIYDINVNKQSTSNVSIFQLALVSKSAPYNLMKTEAERLKKIIERVNGVRKVKLEAYPESEVRIALNSIKMTEMNISLDNIQNAIQSNNATIPGGALKVSDKLFNVKTSGAYSQLEEIKNTVVGSFAGKIIYLKNIASVYFDYEDERYLSRFNGERNLIISIQQKEGYNIFNIADPIREKLAATKLADDMQIEYVFDQAVGVKERVNTFMSNLIQGILLVGVIIFLVLGVRSASIVILTIPLSILIGLASVDFMGFGLQQMSITGLVVALGLLVDNSIAIIENIERFLGMGYSKTEAAIKGTGQLVAPMVSATLTTILAFVPVIMMPETTGAFIKAMPATVIATLVASLVIAVSLTPFMASRILKKRTKESVKLKGTFAFRGLKKFVEGPYRKGLNWALRNRTITLLFALGSFIGAILLFPYVGVSFFPK